MQSWRLCTSRTRAQNIDLAAVQKLTHRVSQCVPQCAYMGREASASACMPRAAESAALTPRSDRLSPALMRAAGRRVRRVCGGGDRARGQAEAGQRPGPAHHARPAHQRARGGPGARPRARRALPGMPAARRMAAHGAAHSMQHTAHGASVHAPSGSQEAVRRPRRTRARFAAARIARACRQRAWRMQACMLTSAQNGSKLVL